MATATQVKAFIEKAAGILAANADELARLDGQSGDGDLGASMSAAGQAMRDMAAATPGEDIGGLLMKVAMACNKAAPSTMGTLVSSGVMALAKTSKGKNQLADADLIAMPRLFGEAIMARGKAQVGDKTILDALMPMADAVEAEFAASGDLGAAFAAGAKAARAGAEATCGMLAKTGRAKWIGERAQEHMDGGAALCAILAEGIIA
ncbi:MAG: DAK2 domain-containing protein [Christensenellaceae bacterium]|nr:DAK2 domain-containing protein [Christensenellaceae bacterium]